MSMVRVFAVVSLRTRRQRAPFALQEEVKKYFQETVAPCLTEGAAPLRAHPVPLLGTLIGRIWCRCSAYLDVERKA